jgi:hypothetical protein
MVALVTGDDEPGEPLICLRLGLRLVEVVKGLVRILDRPKWPFDLAL